MKLPEAKGPIYNFTTNYSAIRLKMTRRTAVAVSLDDPWKDVTHFPKLKERSVPFFAPELDGVLSPRISQAVSPVYFPGHDSGYIPRT